MMIGVLCTYVLIFCFAQIHIFYVEALIGVVVVGRNNINIAAHVNLYLYGDVGGLTAEAAAKVKRTHISTDASIQFVTFGQCETHLIAQINN